MNEIAWIEIGSLALEPASRPLHEILRRLPPGVSWVVLWREVPWQSARLYYVFHRNELASAAHDRPQGTAEQVLDLHEWGQSATAPDDRRPRDAADLPPVTPKPSSSRIVALDGAGNVTAVGVEPAPVARMAPPPAPSASAPPPAAPPPPAPPPPPPPPAAEPSPAASPPSGTRGGGLSDLLGGFRRRTRRGGTAEATRGIEFEPPASAGAPPESALPESAPPESAPPESAPPAGGATAERPAPASPPEAAAMLSAHAPEQVAIGEDALIDVRVELADEATPLAHALAATVRVDTAERAADPIRVILSVGDPTLEITGPRMLTLAAPGPGKPAVSAFEVRGKGEGDARVAVMFRQGSADLGTLSFAVRVVAARTSAGRVTVEEEAEPAAGQTRPDLTVLIQERQSGNEVRYAYLVDSDLLNLNFAEFESRAFKSTGGATAAPLAYVQGVYERIVERALVNMGDVRTFARELKAIGTDLCRQLLDDDFVRALWPVRDRVHAVQVTSWEPYIPWELLRLTHPDTEETDDRFLGEYGLVRSLSGRKLARRLALRDWSYLVAEYPEGSAPNVGREVEYLENDLPARGIRPTRLPSDYEAVLDALAAAEFDVLHVACHGTADHTKIDQSELVIGDRRTPEGVVDVSLHPATVREEARLKSRHPLVFLNACESGRAGGSLTDLGGWPQAFIGAGAGAFVGTSWSVREKPATTFARAFYDALLAGRTLAEAAREARGAAKALGDGSWLAFVVYGEPSARMEV